MDFQELLAFAERHSMLSLGLVAITVALICTEIARLFRGYKALRPAELTALINRENALVVDLSASNDFEKGHIAGSKSVQLSQFDPRTSCSPPPRRCRWSWSAATGRGRRMRPSA